MPERRQVHDVPSTPHFDFLYGAFRLSNWHIPYFATTLNLSTAANSLKLTTEIPGSERIAWRLDELFQRDINWPRVERQIVPYLRNSQEPQFFNSITIALMPFDPRTEQLLPDFHASSDWTPPSLEDPDRFSKTLEVGPLSFGHWNSWTSPQDLGFRSGQLRWNPQQVFGVAIDGQHRLSAIKSFVEGGGVTQAAIETQVPVLLLIFDDRLGFEAPENKPIIELLRALFIDLNKHAQVVSRARQILLDDRDPHAVCVRALVGEHLQNHLDSLHADPPRLPLALVDWHTEQAKFDDGPYLTTVLGLDWIVARALNTRPIADFTRYGQVRTQIRSLERQLDIRLPEANRRLDDLENMQLSPFAYSDQELDNIADAFATTWATPLCHILTTFTPYRELIQHRASDGTLELEFQNWYQLRERKREDRFAGRATTEYQQLLGRLTNRPDSPVSERTLEGQLEALRHLKGDSLAFKVVFQRALIDALLEYVKIDATDIDELRDLADEDLEDIEPDFEDADSPPQDSDYAEDEDADGGSAQSLEANLTHRTKEFVEYVNQVVDAWPEFLELGTTFEGDDEELRPFWLGTLLKAEGGIDFTASAAARAKDVIFLAASMCLYVDSHEGADPDFEDYWAECLEGSGPSIINRVGRAVRRLTKDESSAAGRILKAAGEEYDTGLARDEIYHRMSCLWSELDL